MFTQATEPELIHPPDLGLARSYLPTVGRVTIIMNDQPIVKYLLIGVLAIFVLTSKE